MALALYNTLTRRKEPFEPLDPGHVRMYVCGPTVYDFAHIGNARPVVVFDVLYRLLRRLYPKVTYVRNITDVDDKIIQAAKETGEPIDAITRRFTEAYHADMAALGALPPDVEPRATGHVPQMLAMIEKLIASGHAYAAEGHVLFSVQAMPGYGRLSRHSREELIAGARVEVAPYKKDPADFVLWKPSTGDQPGWDSPWGFGRPGWHLECSAMSETHLGETFDIHGGGQDLIFPHHENEIAQSTCAHGGAPFVRYWMHNGYLTVNGEKMSKSLGNFYTVRQLLDDGWDGEEIRLCLLSAQYRQPLDFSIEALERSHENLRRLYTALRGHSLEELDYSNLVVANDPVISSLKNDLNTPDALHYLFLEANLVFKTEDPVRKLHHKKSLRKSGYVLGLIQRDPEDYLKRPRVTKTDNLPIRDREKIEVTRADGTTEAPLDEVRQKVTGSGDLPAGSAAVSGGGIVHDKQLDEDWIDELIEERAQARKTKDFKKADRIRNELKEQGIILEDRPDGTTDWRRA